MKRSVSATNGRQIHRITRIAIRDFRATVLRKGFVIALLTAPTLGGLMILFGPSIFNETAEPIEGVYAVIDPTGAVGPAMTAALRPSAIAERRWERIERRLGNIPQPRGLSESAITELTTDRFGPAPKIELEALAAKTDVAAASAQVLEPSHKPRRSGVIVINEHAVKADASGELGSYELYVHPDTPNREVNFVRNTVEASIVDARVSPRVDPAELDVLLDVQRPQVTKIGIETEDETAAVLKSVLPIAYMILMSLGVMTGGQTMLSSMVEEKSTRIVEMLLSAVSAFELMAGKLLAGVAITMVALVLYLGIGFSVVFG